MLYTLATVDVGSLIFLIDYSHMLFETENLCPTSVHLMSYLILEFLHDTYFILKSCLKYQYTI